MSSYRGGATGAGKPKPVNVNSVYSGRNLAAGNRPAGKHGMQSVGRNLGVVRRMPPPATLPSLKAENNGQDPTINIVPQAGSGWSKGEGGETGPVRAAAVVPQSTAGSDMRPTWAKAQAPEPAASSGPAHHQPQASAREFPTLANSAQGKEGTPANAWTAGAPPFAGRTLSTSESVEDDRQLPSRYYDSKPSGNSYRPRFQGSSDARASQPNYYNRMDCERGDSFCDSVGGRSDSSDVRNRQASENLDNEENERNNQEAPVDPDRELAMERSRQKRMNFKSVSEDHEREVELSQNGHSSQRVAPQPEYRLLKRPERVEQPEEASDDEEDIQLTKLNKPAVRIMKRVPVGNENEAEGKESADSTREQSPKPKKVEAPVQKERKPEIARREERPPVAKEPMRQPVEKAQQQVEVKQPPVEDVVPAPPPSENIWAKRKEERESQEKDKSRMPKALQQAIEHHFPTVGDTAAIKIDKDVSRRPADSDFARAALRARRANVSNDVRSTMRREDDRRQQHQQQYSRDDNTIGRDYSNQRYQQQQQRPIREHSDLGDYRNTYSRNQPPPRNNGRDRYNPEQEQRRPEEYSNEQREPAPYHHERGTYAPRGARQPKVAMGRGRGRPSTIHHHQTTRTHPQYQIQRRPQQHDDEERDVEDIPSEAVPQEQKIVSVGEETKTIAPVVPASEAKEETKTDVVPTAFNGDSASGDYRHQPMERGGHAFRGRGRGGRIRGDDRRRPYQPQQHRGEGGLEGQQQPRPQRRPRNLEEGGEQREMQQGGRFVRGAYSQQRARRGGRGGDKNMGTKISRETPQPRSSEEPVCVEDNRLKSPVVSSEGHEEWETASESSNRFPRHDEKEHSVEKPSFNGKEKSSSSISAERMRSKNGQPARRTCRSPSDGNSRQPPLEKVRQPSRDKSSDGLAGLDINNIASVVVIDEHLQETVSAEASAEFEEVMNKKMRKQKALELQMKQEAEEKRKLKEKERLDKLQARKAARAAATKDAKKAAAERKKQASLEKLPEGKKEEKEPQAVVEKATKEGKGTPPVRKEIPVTTVWNSAHVAAMDKQRQEESARLPSHIPSPIARPTPKSKKSFEANKEERHPVVELPVSLSTDNHLKGDKYDFTFDPHIHEAQTREQAEKSSSSSNMSNVCIPVESGNIAEDYRLKEKLNKVKDLWGEGVANETAAPLPSNVAKVKPQPQGGEQPPVDQAKGLSPSGAAGSPAVQQRSPSITPFSTASFGFPNYLHDMTNAYVPASHGASVGPPSNATSPPAPMSVGAPYMQQRPSGGRNTFMDNNMYNPMAAQQRQQSMWAPNAAVDNVMPFGNTPPPMSQHQSAQFNFNNRGNIPHHPPPPMQRGYGPNNMSGGQQKMGGGPPPMMFGPPQMPPMDMMSMNMPPPPHNVGNPHLGAVGSQRNDRPQPPFASLMGNSFAPSQPPPHFSQPPPDIRFAQPPPPFGHDHHMSWQHSQKHFNSQQPSMGGNFRGQPPMSHHRGGMPLQANDVWANMNAPIQTFQHHHNGGHRMHSGGNMSKGGPRGGGPSGPGGHHDRGDMKRPSSGGQQASNGASA